jgi:hypothetical protein
MDGARGGDGDCVHGEGILAVLARPTAAAGPGHACGARRRERALFVSDVVDALDQQPRPSGLSPGEDGGALGVGYAIGVTSSRKLEQKSFVQGYNAPIAVDGHAQIIVAAAVTQTPNDKQKLEPMAEWVTRNVGRLAEVTSADAGYFSERAVERAVAMGTELLVPPGRQKHRETEPRLAPLPADASVAERMRYKLQSDLGRALYKPRKAIAEPVFGQLNVRAEFLLMALTHNHLKLFRLEPRLAASA